jgi:isopentenyldiphosphate isomerase
MEIHEIYLNKLFSREELYKETASKLGCGSISGKDELMGCLMSFTKPHEFRLYVSDEDVENEAVSEITDVFKTCDANSHMVSTEILVDEFLNLIDSHSRLTHAAKPRSLVHRDGDLHPTVHIWLIKRRDMGLYVLLQKRSHEKVINPDCYDVSAAGHVSQGGEFRHAAVRELKEELGIDITGNQLELIGLRNNYYSKGDIKDNELSAVYLCRENIDADKLVLQSSEVSEVCWVEIDEFLSIMKVEDLPNCISMEELSMIKKAVF